MTREREREIERQGTIYSDIPANYIEWSDGYDTKDDKAFVETAFIEGAKWADKTQIERVLEFIFNYFYEHPHVNGHICTDSFESLEELEEELIKAMEE